MAVIDYIIIILAVLSLISGARSGLISQLGSLAGILLGVWLAHHFNGQLGEWIGVEELPTIASYAILFAVGAVAALLLARILSAIFHSIGLRGLDIVGGAAVSLVSFVLVASLVVGLLRGVDNQLQTNILSGSECVPIIEDVADVIFPYLVSLKDVVVEHAPEINPDDLGLK